MLESKEQIRHKGISSVLVPCSARKSKLHVPALNARSLSFTSILDAAKDWTERLQRAKGLAELAAKDLYAGRAVKTAYRFAKESRCSFFIASAGLGLVAAHTRIPSYELSVLSVVPSLSTSGREFIAKWWKAIEAGPFSSPLTTLGKGNGRILVAITQPYAALISEGLASLPRGQRNRLRIFGFGLERYLPTSLRSQILRYDQRLDLCMPGVGFDRATRALVHFGKLIGDRPLQSLERDQDVVDVALSLFPRRHQRARKRESDETLAKHIGRYAAQGKSMSIALKQLRTKDGFACEQKRFRRLYLEARA